MLPETYGCRTQSRYGTGWRQRLCLRAVPCDTVGQSDDRRDRTDRSAGSAQWRKRNWKRRLWKTDPPAFQAEGITAREAELHDARTGRPPRPDEAAVPPGRRWRG